MNSNKINYLSLLFKYSKEDVTNFVFTQNNYDSTLIYDIAIVFGGISMIPYRVDKALDLYNNKKIKKILLTGGIGYFSKDRKNREALKMKEYLLIKGVSEEDILCESNSRNTNENIQKSISIIKSNYDITKINILLITSDFHLKRCINLLKVSLPKCLIHGVGVKDGINDKDHWIESFSSKKVIYSEAFLLNHNCKK